MPCPRPVSSEADAAGTAPRRRPPLSLARQRGNQLYVNRGIGFSVTPILLNYTPGLTVFTLRAAA